MASIFHAGEQAVQARAGGQHRARRVADSIHAVIPDAAREFLLRQPFAVVGSRNRREQVWASLLWGLPGFLRVEDDTTLRIDASPVMEDPLAEVLAASADQPEKIGILTIEPATRRRMRLNGTVRRRSDGSLSVSAEQVYSNCPKYIQKRTGETGPTDAAAAPHTVQRGCLLTAAQEAAIARADTFFIASAHPEAGVDASHRGGNPGFVRVAEGRTLQWPDYAGNAMFNTLGNLAVNPSAGLLFLDFGSGGTLQLTGKARILWDAEEAERFSGAERVVSFAIEEAIETAGAFPLRYRLQEYSPFNPA